MAEMDPLAERINRLAEAQKKDKEAEASVEATEQEALGFLYTHAQRSYDNLMNLIEQRLDKVNPQINGVPPFSFNRGQRCVVQGNVAAYLVFYQQYVNAGKISLTLSFARQPGAFYIDESYAPKPEHYRLEAAVTSQKPFKIIWQGDLGELTNENLPDFVLQQLTDYYLRHQP